jgi:hypothetical protein
VSYLPGLASNHDPPDLCLLSNWDYSVSHWHLAIFNTFTMMYNLAYYLVLGIFIIPKEKLNTLEITPHSSLSPVPGNHSTKLLFYLCRFPYLSYSL